MDWITIEAKSVEEAIERALDGLGVARDEAEIEVVEEPKQGLFGWTRGSARVRARVAPRQTRAKVERGRKRRRDRGGAKGSNGRDNAKPKGQSGKGGKAKGSGEGEAGRRSSGKPNNDGRRQGTKNGPDGGGNGGGSKRSNQAESAKNGHGRKEPVVDEVSVEDVSAHVEQFLTGLTTAFGYEGKVEVSTSEDDGVLGMVVGQHGLMVGPKARTLDAIQELTRVSAQRSKPSSVRIKVDVGGYRQVRKDALEKFAVDVANAARAEGVERSFEPMTSADRKIVHDALSSVEGIETRSIGDDNRRRVVVVPVGDPPSAPDSDSDSGSDSESGAVVAQDNDAGEGDESTQDS